jgi:hypothetical protein
MRPQIEDPAVRGWGHENQEKFHGKYSVYPIPFAAKYGNFGE